MMKNVSKLTQAKMLVQGLMDSSARASFLLYKGGVPYE